MENSNGGFLKKHQTAITIVILILAVVSLVLSIIAFTTKCKSAFEEFDDSYSNSNYQGGPCCM